MGFTILKDRMAYEPVLVTENHGNIRHTKTGYCLDSLGHKVGEYVGISRCHGQGGNQVFAITESGAIRVYIGCIDGGDKRNTGTGKLIFHRCSSDNFGQVFEISDKVSFVFISLFIFHSLLSEWSIQRGGFKP
ncbi:unnamed protein product [Trichobilharzia regenti]|nr:unnamed protein product [Trichobilharzia regenti]